METNSSLSVVYERIGKRLYTLRHARDEKLISVAKSVGVSHAVVSQIENGRYKSLSFEMLAKIAIYYRVSIDDIISS